MDNRIQKVSAAATEAFTELKQIQTGEKPLVKTGTQMIDCHIGGLLPSDVVVIAGAPSSGKSETLYGMLDQMLDTNLNPTAGKYVSLEFSFEMKFLNKILRKTHSLLGLKKSEILFSTFEGQNREKVAEYFNDLQDDRRYVCQSPVSSDEFYTMARQFCLEHADKEAILLSVDHLLLFSGSDKQLVLEKVCEAVNLLKIEFKNVYFFLLSQLNRTSQLLPKDKDNSMMPNNSMLFGSSFVEHLANYIVIITNPFLAGITQYLKVNNTRYQWLESFYGDRDGKGRVSFKTLGNLFYFVTKMRESDNSYKNLFIKAMDLTEEQKERMEAAVEAPAEPTSMPVFDSIKGFNTDALQNNQGVDFNDPFS